jgi:pseudaminic acid synthase
MRIGTHDVQERVLVVAELSANHGQKKEVAREALRAARRAGADAIKLQTYTPDTLTIDCDNEYFRISGGTPWDGRTLYQLYQEAYTPWEWHEELFRIARAEGLLCFSTPFDKTAVDFLEQFEPPAFKIASFEIQDIPLIEYGASKGRPMILSTGVAELEDIHLAVQTCRAAGNDRIILLKCTSAYPAPVDEANLLTLSNMRETFGVEVGLSDHTLGIAVPVAAVALGARVIEKHFILDRALGGPDAAFSLNGTEFAAMVTAVREAELALGRVSYALSEKVKTNRRFARSLFAVADIAAGEIITELNVRSIRPGDGLPVRHLPQILGRHAKKDIRRGTPLSWDLLD